MKKVKRLYQELKPEHYDLLLAPDREKLEFSGRVVIKARKTGRPSYRLTLHQKDLKVSKAKIIRHDKRSGATEITVERINPQKSFDELRLHTKEQLFAGEYTIELEFSGKIHKKMHGIYPCEYEIDGVKKQLIATQFESHHAREAFPCVDEPEAKATFQLTLESPAGECAISNTPAESQTEKAGRLVTVFQKTPVMSTYLLAFAYGELGYKEAKTKNDISVRVYATQDKVELTDFALDAAVRCLEFFEDYYGVPYPLPKLDLIGLPDFSAGAMENWGLVTFRESVLYVDPKNSSVETKQFVAMVVCHELAHQWFGNLVTMKWWNDLWLNESFADLMEYRAVDELFPEWHIWQEFAKREIGAALSRDALPNVQTVQTEVNHPDELSAIFDPSIVYAKGGSLLNMVRWLVGEDNFRAGLKSYFEEFKYQNTVADDLWRHLKESSGLNVGAIMHNWLQRPGYPLLEVDYHPGEASLKVFQQRLTIGGGEPDKTIWQVPLALSVESDIQLLTSRKAEFNLEAPTDSPLVLNHLGHSYFVSRYVNEDHKLQILKAIHAGELDPIDRLLFIQSNLLLEKADKAYTVDNIKLLQDYANERDEAVWSNLAGVIGNVRGLIGIDDELEKSLNGFVRPITAALVSEFGWEGSEDEPAQTKKMRALALSLAAAAQDPDVINKGLELFKKFKAPADLPPDIRQVVYFIAVRYGSPADFDKLLAEFKNNSNADEKDEIAAELTSTKESERIKQLLSMITGPDVRLQDGPTWYAWLLRNRYGTQLAWQWLKDNWGWVKKNYGDDKSYDRFPRYSAMVFSRPEELAEYKKFFEPKISVALQLPIKLGIEEIEGRLGWRRRNEPGVFDWLRGL